MNTTKHAPLLRLVTSKKPRPYGQGESDEYPLDALEIVPLLSNAPEDDLCLVVAYDDLASSKVEGDSIHFSLQEALEDARENFDIERSDWVLPPGFDSIEVLYQAARKEHFALYGHLIPPPQQQGPTCP